MTRKVVNLEEFNELSQKLKLEILHKDGAHVGKRVVEGHIMILFQLYSFYVEVHYEIYRKDVRHIFTTGSSDVLQPYLNQIHIEGLDTKSGGNIK